MPPLQPSSSFDSATIPFADQSASPFDKLFETDLTTAQTHYQTQEQQHGQQQQEQPDAPAIGAPLSEADISALFGLPSSGTYSQAPVAPPSQQPALMTPAPLAPPAHYSSLQQQHYTYEKSPIAPIPASPTFYQQPSSASLSSSTLAAQSTTTATTTMTHAAAARNIQGAHHRYPSCTASTYSQAPETHRTETQLQAYEARQSSSQPYNNSHQYTPYQQYDPNQFHVDGYSVINADYSNFNDYNNYQGSGFSAYSAVDLAAKNNQRSTADPLMLNAPSRSVFSRLGTSSGNGSLSTAGQSTFAPKLAKVAVSYVSSTLAVTSTFASEKLASASTRIADLWQHSQHVLPQQQPQHQSQQQQTPQQQQERLQHEDLYNHGSCYNAATAAASKDTTINSEYSNYENQQSVGAYWYDGQVQGQGQVSNNTLQNNNFHYQSSSYSNTSLNINNNSNTSSSRNPFATTATSKLSNVASVAGSYLPSLSKLPALPALPALSTLPALPALPVLPWGNRDRSQQLPQQRPSANQQYSHTQEQGHPSTNYYGSYEGAAQEPVYSQPEQHPSAYDSSQQVGGGLLAGAGNWWGGIRNEVQKGRRMVQTGVEVGVAWWWDTDAKNPLRNVV
ncbi:hypothetical protein BGX28_008491 [Mortierella sp. GBA30]|nr:hypothetical protein BGX28_008491 [Mortierella sp. GBA30]